MQIQNLSLLRLITFYVVNSINFQI